MMRVLYGFDDLPSLRDPVVTVGSYDGVHTGHRELLTRVVRIAQQQNAESVVVTFAPHPRVVLGDCREEVTLLNTLAEKTCLLEQIGIDNLIVVPFTKTFSRMSPTAFVRECLVGRLGARRLVVGYDHHFGRDQQGDAATLEQLQNESGFSIHEVPEHEMRDGKVSSTTIRRLIGSGDMAAAERLLGYPYLMIVSRDGDGRLIPGDACKLIPPPGTYPVRVGEATSRSAGEPDTIAACGGAGKQTFLYIGMDKSLTLDPPAAEGAQNNILITFLSK